MQLSQVYSLFDSYYHGIYRGVHTGGAERLERAMVVCKDVEDWIKEQVEQKVVQQEKRCKKWPWPLSWLCQLVTTIIVVLVWVVRKIIRVVCEVVWVAINLVAALLNLLATIPIVGFLARAIARGLATIGSYIAGQFDGVARLIGIHTTKNLRIHVVPLCRSHVPMARKEHLEPIMEVTARTLYERAQIRAHITYHSPVVNAPETSLRIGGGIDMVLDEAWLKGSWFQVHAVTLFESNLWMQMGIGNPVIVYVVDEVGYDRRGAPGVAGVSGGPFVDWVAVEAISVVRDIQGRPQPVGDPIAIEPNVIFPPVVESMEVTVPTTNPNYNRYTVAHEICHALGLMGHANSGPGDLMAATDVTGDALSPFQVGIIRSSAKVTYF